MEMIAILWKSELRSQLEVRSTINGPMGAQAHEVFPALVPYQYVNVQR